MTMREQTESRYLAEELEMTTPDDFSIAEDEPVAVHIETGPTRIIQAGSAEDDGAAGYKLCGCGHLSFLNDNETQCIMCRPGYDLTGFSRSQ